MIDSATHETIAAVELPSDEAPPALQPSPTWWVTRKGTPMCRHTRHKRKATKTACKLGLSRYRAATDDEIARLGVCVFCVPVAAPPQNARRRR